MDDFKKPIYPMKGPLEEPIRVEPIGKDKKVKDEQYTSNSTDEKKKLPAIFAATLSILKNVTKVFSSKKQTSSLSAYEKLLINSLTEFKKAIISIEERDVSIDASYAQNLSELFYQITTLHSQIVGSHLGTKINLAKMQRFFQLVHSYPENERSLAFYLQEFAGKDWLPFPFIEMLKNLHKEYSLHKETSTLYIIEKTLQEIIDTSFLD